MKRPAFSLVILFSLLAVTTHGQWIDLTGTLVETKIEKQLNESFKSYAIYQVDSKNLSRQIEQQSDPFLLNIKLENHLDIQINLTKAPILSSDFSVTKTSAKGKKHNPEGENKTFSGYLTRGGKGNAALTIDTGFIYGFFEIDHQTFFIEPLKLRGLENETDHFLVYKASDVLDNSPQHCAFDHLAKTEKQVQIPSTTTKNNEGCHVVEIAIATDWLLYDFFGNSETVENFVIGNLNMVQTNYDDEFASEIQFQLVTLYISDCETCDPWADVTDSYSLLQVFRNWGNSGGFDTDFDVASLWSKRDFDGDLVGLAWPGTLCANNRYNVLQHYISNAANLRVLQAHELGHNFSAQHDEAGDYTIMAPSVTTSMEWSSTSQEVINTYIDYIANNFDCFSNCPNPPAPVADFEVPVTHVCPGSIVPFIDNSDDAETLVWDFGANFPNSNVKNPKVIFEDPGSYPVDLTAVNTSGWNTASQTIQVDDDGVKYLFYETFESFPDNWIIFNPDNNVPWLWYPVANQAFGQHAMMIDNYNNSNEGQLDALVSPSFSLEGEIGIFLEFDIAYARRNENQPDTFRILLSTDGGASFTNQLLEIAENGNGNLATVPDSEDFFTPEEISDWCTNCFSIPLDEFSGSSQVKLMFLNENGNGNNLYLDNIRVRSSCNFVELATPDFFVDNAIGCAPFTAQFHDNSSGVINNRIWQFESGIPGFSTAMNPSAVFSNPGTYDVSLTLFNDAGNNTKTEENFITVLPSATADFSYEIDGTQVTFTNNSTGGDGYLWDFGNQQTSTMQNPTQDYESEGIYTIQLITSNECSSDTTQQEIALFLSPQAAFEVSDQQICTGASVTFSALSDNDDYSYSWTFEGGTPSASDEINPIVSYNQIGSFGVQLIVSNPTGSDTLSMDQYISVGEAPAASFSHQIIEGTGEVHFFNESNAAISYQWDFGDEQFSGDPEPVHLFSSEGNYLVSLIAENDCGSDTSFQTVSIVFQPEAGFSVTSASGCVPIEIQFNNESSGAEATYQWFFEGGSPAQSEASNPLITYSTSGQFDVQLIVNNPIGSDTLLMEQFINLDTLPDPAFLWNQDELTVEFSNFSENADAYHWDFGDDSQSTETMPVHTFPEPGTYYVTFTATNNCGNSTITDTLGLFGSSPEVFVDYEPDFGCIPLTVEYSAVVQNADSVAWYFEGGSPDFSNELNQVVTYENPGSFEVILEGFNVFGSTIETIPNAVLVNDPPTATFEFEQIGGTVNFYNFSEGAHDYVWQFGDDMTSDEENPAHFYEVSGLYEIQLIAINECGSDTLMQEINIIIDDLNSLNENSSVDVFPNPASEKIFIRFNNTDAFLQGSSLHLFDALGRKVSATSLIYPITEVSVSHLPKGIYFYEINNETQLMDKGKVIIL
ncbi:MAG: PKD domain-containing protein [Bacteroidetes bacterium]|nr:MAG: PKD domain-containing protein [Bacteroidota bacterium]